MPIPKYLTKRFGILLIKFRNRIASRLEFLNFSLHILVVWDERWETERMEEKKTNLRDERQRAWRKRRHIWEIRDREQGEGAAKNAFKFRVRRKYAIYTCFFFSSSSLVEPGRFGSVQSVSDFGNRNRTESEMFCNFLIS